MLLNQQGLKISAFEPFLASVLGNAKGEEGFKVVTEARLHRHGCVEIRDWLYCLVKSPGTSLRKFLIERPGKTPEAFITLVEGALGDDEQLSGPPPSELTKETATPSVAAMLSRAEEISRNAQHQSIKDASLSLALLETADSGLTQLLKAWATEKALGDFQAELNRKIAPQSPSPDVFNANGLNIGLFDATGVRMIYRWQEDMASMGVTKMTSRHLLYSLLGDDAGPLAIALATSGMDVKKDLHSVLSRELVRPGRKRNESFVLGGDTVFAAVEGVLKEAFKSARQRGSLQISAHDVHVAFIEKEAAEITRLFTRENAIDLEAVRDRVREFQTDADTEPPLQRFSITEIEQKIKNTIFGQEEALSRVLPWIKRLRFGLPRDERPAGVFLFLGPTGAGKTQMAKELARYVYGSEEMIIFLEMGQFKTKEAMNQFIGAPPGYVGYGEGKLTNGLRDKPESVVLFDEIEKADTSVFDTLLRFADEGMISDPAGPVRNGRKCIIVMTTNAGQTWLRRHLQEHPEAREDPEVLSQRLFVEAMKELADKGFRPEFLGRVDERITFLPFSLKTCRQIVENVLAKEIAKLKKLKQVDLDVMEDVHDLLAQCTFNNAIDEGARGAPRTINRLIVTRAIDFLSDYEERGAPLPSKLIAVKVRLEEVEIEVVQ